MNQHPTTADPTAVLTALRPGTTTAQGWNERAHDAIRLQILASDPAADAPGPAHRTSTHRRRIAVAAAGALLFAGGSGVAVAGGHLPLAFTQAFSTWNADWSMNGVEGVDPDTAERVATTAGPDGTTFTVMAATTTTTDGAAAACTVIVLETAASTREVGPSQFQDVSSNGCQPTATGQAFQPIGVEVAYADDSTLGVLQDLWVWSATSGGAVGAEVITADGRTWPVVSYDGAFYGWFPAPGAEEARPQLVAFAADGSEVDRTSL